LRFQRIDLVDESGNQLLLGPVTNVRSSERLYLPVASLVACDERSNADDRVVDVLRELVTDRFTDLVVGAAVEPVGAPSSKHFRNRVLAIPHRVDYLSARQTLALTQELRTCLDELADDKGA
jgi:hypothetical protein